MSEEEEVGEAFRCVVFDIGSTTTRVCFSDDPDSVQAFPTTMGLVKKGDKNWIVGKEIVDNWGKYAIRKKPFTRCNIRNMDYMESYWNDLFENKMKIDSKTYPLLYTITPGFGKKIFPKTTEILFEKYEIPSIYFVDPLVLSSCVVGCEDGLYLHSGGDTSYCFSMFYSQPAQSTLFRMNLAGNDCTYQMASSIAQKVDLTRLRFKDIDDIKKSVCYAAHEGEEEAFGKMCQLPDGNKIIFKNERTEATEILFDDELTPSLGKMCCSSIEKFPEKYDRYKAYKNVQCFGGNTYLENFTEGLMLSIKNNYPKEYGIGVNTNIENSAVFGAQSFLAFISGLEKSWFSKSMYEEHGPRFQKIIGNQFVFPSIGNVIASYKLDYAWEDRIIGRNIGKKEEKIIKDIFRHTTDVKAKQENMRLKSIIEDKEEKIESLTEKLKDGISMKNSAISGKNMEKRLEYLEKIKNQFVEARESYNKCFKENNRLQDDLEEMHKKMGDLERENFNLKQKMNNSAKAAALMDMNTEVDLNGEERHKQKQQEKLAKRKLIRKEKEYEEKSKTTTTDDEWERKRKEFENWKKGNVAPVGQKKPEINKSEKEPVEKVVDIKKVEPKKEVVASKTPETKQEPKPEPKPEPESEQEQEPERKIEPKTKPKPIPVPKKETPAQMERRKRAEEREQRRLDREKRKEEDRIKREKLKAEREENARLRKEKREAEILGKMNNEHKELEDARKAEEQKRIDERKEKEELERKEQEELEKKKKEELERKRKEEEKKKEEKKKKSEKSQQGSGWDEIERKKREFEEWKKSLKK